MDFYRYTKELKKMSGMEYIWGIIAIFSISAGIYYTFSDGITESYPLFIITFIAGVMFKIRNTLRHRNN